MKWQEQHEMKWQQHSIQETNYNNQKISNTAIWTIAVRVCSRTRRQLTLTHASTRAQNTCAHAALTHIAEDCVYILCFEFAADLNYRALMLHTNCKKPNTHTTRTVNEPEAHAMAR